MFLHFVKKNGGPKSNIFLQFGLWRGYFEIFSSKMHVLLKPPWFVTSSCSLVMFADTNICFYLASNPGRTYFVYYSDCLSHFKHGLQDHNKDYIVEFPDISPPTNQSGLSIRRDLSPMNHRFSLREVSSQLPQPHMWYSQKEVVKALKLFLDAGSSISGSLTYR